MLKVAVAVDPVMVVPVDAVTVQVPAGRPVSSTLPLSEAQVVCVRVLMPGALGVTG